MPQSDRTLRTLFGALVVVLGAQSMRFLFGSITWYLRDTVGIGVIDLIPIALAPFFFGAIFPILSKWMSVRGALWSGVWLLIFARTILQISGDPAIDFWMASAATAAFVGLLPLMLSVGRSALVGGVLLGLAIDGAIKGMGLSLDLAYQTGIGPLLGVLAISAALLWALWACPPFDRASSTWGSGALLIGIGPFLFFQALILQNQGWTSEAAGIGGAQAQLRIALLNVVALIAVSYLERSRLAVGLALVTVTAAIAVAEGDPLVFNILSLLAVPAAGLLWSSMVPDTEERGLAPTGTYLVVGMSLFVTLGLLYYVPLDLDLGFTQSQARFGALVLLVLFGIGGMLALPGARPGVAQQAWAFAALASILPLLGFFLATRASDAPAEEPALRAMTYNIHSSFNTAGGFDIEAIARVIEDSRATVVGLQEIPRGRLLSGVTDQVTLLQNRLGFEHVAFFGTTDPTWGNAVMSRYPIVDVDEEYLPLVGTPMRRGYLGATIRVDGREVVFISTHLQHVNDSAVHDDDPEADLYPVHTEQIATILDTWEGHEPAILVGDFNARPDWKQIEEILDAGWVDSWSETGVGDGFTASSDNPRYRIDYVFHTPGLVAEDAGVIQSQASDHRPVVADLVFG